MTKDDIIRIETALKIAYEIGFENGKKAQPEQEPVAFAAEILEDVNGVLSTRWADWWIPNEGDKLYTTPPAAQPEQEPCVGKDPRCPCQDGDACHYKDCGDTKARPVAQPEQVDCPRCGHVCSQRPWQGLTDEEVKHEWEVWRASLPRYIGFAQGIETKLKERNT